MRRTYVDVAISSRNVASRREAAPSANGQDLVSMQAYLDRVEQSRRDAERELERSEAALAERRQALTEASRRRQALERLKERRAAEHATETARRECALLDEVASAAHARRGRGGFFPSGEAA